MSRLSFIALLLAAGGCASVATPGIPDVGPPFSASRPIVWPSPLHGQLQVVAFPKNARSKQPGTTAAWRLFDVDGHALTDVRRDNADLDLVPGAYVVLAKDTDGRMRTAQFVVRSSAITHAVLPSESLPTEDALVADE